MAQRLNQKPRRVAARPRTAPQRLFGCLNPWLHADDVTDPVAQLCVEVDEEVHGVGRFARNACEIFREQRRDRLGLQIRREFVGEISRILKRKCFCVRLDEKVERIDHRHIGDVIYLDLEFERRFGKHEAREPIPLRILLPVDEVLLRQNLQRIAGYARTGVWRGPQPDDLRPEADRLVVPIMCDVMQGDGDGHCATTSMACF